MSITKIDLCTGVSMSSIEEAVSTQKAKNIIPNLLSQMAYAKQRAKISSKASHLQQSADNADNAADQLQEAQHPLIFISSSADGLSDSLFLSTALPNLEERIKLGSRGLKIRLCKAVQPANPSED